jgi:GNAT superfamily N-acetyltransferase
MSRDHVRDVGPGGHHGNRSHRERTFGGIARSLSDFHYCTYLSDLAVDVQFQRQGIGRALIEQTHLAAGKHTMLLLLSAPKAASYYPHTRNAPPRECMVLSQLLTKTDLCNTQSLNEALS